MSREGQIVEDDEEVDDDEMECVRWMMEEEDEEEMGGGIVSLPDGILLSIFSYLDLANLLLGVRSTCWHWRNLSYDFSLWRCLDLSEYPLITDRIFVDLIRTIHNQVEEVNVSGCSSLSDMSFRHLTILTCPNLRRLHLQCTMISDSTLEMIVDKYRDLERLTLFSCPRLTHAYSQLARLPALQQFIDPYDQMGDLKPEDLRQGLITIATRCPLLKEVIVDSSDGIDDDVIELMASKCPNLQKVQLPACVNVTNAGLKTLSHMSPVLKSLNISGSLAGDEGVSYITLNCPQLEALRVSVCTNVTDITFRNVGSMSRNLKYLIVNDLPGFQGNITNTGLRQVAKGCPKLQGLALCYCAGVSDIGIISVSQQCKQLRYLQVTGCDGVTDTGIKALTMSSKNLRRLVASHCKQISARSVNRLVASCPKLDVIEVDCCPYIKTLNFEEAVKNEMTIDYHFLYPNMKRDSTTFTPLPTLHLTVLDLSRCQPLVDTSLLQIAKYAKLLQILLLHDCRNISDLGLCAVAKGCRHLQQLDISYSSNGVARRVTDVTLMALAKYSRDIYHINMWYNNTVTEEGLVILVKKAPMLQKINITARDESAVAHAAEACRKTCSVSVRVMAQINVDNDHRNIIMEFPPLWKDPYSKRNGYCYYQNPYCLDLTF